MKIKKILFTGTVCILVAVIAYSGYRLWDIGHNYAEEERFYSQLTPYKPEVPDTAPTDENGSAAPSSAAKSNQSVIDLQAKYPDAAGWLTVPGTGIDYPFAQARDNDYYLHRGLDGKYLYAGTLFLDYRCDKNFTGFNNVIFGHHMKNGSMFGALQDFNSRTVFNTNTSGTIFLADRTYKIEFFAFIVIKSDDALIYNTGITENADKTAFLDDIKSAARYYRDIGVTAEDRVVTLSTCNYEFNNARMVLIGKLAEI